MLARLLHTFCDTMLGASSAKITGMKESVRCRRVVKCMDGAAFC
jgi:hypothetical protein